LLSGPKEELVGRHDKAASLQAQVSKANAAQQSKNSAKQHATLVVRNQINIINNNQSQQIFSKDPSQSSVANLNNLAGIAGLQMPMGMVQMSGMNEPQQRQQMHHGGDAMFTDETEAPRQQAQGQYMNEHAANNYN